MPVFQLTNDIIFPPPQLAEPDGLLAIDGDLSPARLLTAYSTGIFPWYSAGEPILWWSPTPRLVLFPEKFHLSKRLARTLRQNRFSISADTAFEQVIRCCADTRLKVGEQTWITDEMQEAYILLHKMGFAHSIECWTGNDLVGGLYGVSLDNVFFGESMFSTVSDSSKAALATLARNSKKLGIKMMDCQMTTKHLQSLGAQEITGKSFRNLLDLHISTMTPQKKWRLY
ncbi:MAG: leucyl/phenylalanyl-tRNA--protein transferase [Desulfobulbaceae bacterium]|nr:leucyl/phenylalanyl-tRNA--protein transferase [Desulfobulbaceae bacterium]